MKEIRRIFMSRRLIMGLALILLLNGVLFASFQKEINYGLNLKLPSDGFAILDGTFTVTHEPVDAKAAYQRYSEWLDRARKLPLADAVTMLTDEKAALSAKITGDTDTEDDRLDYVAINNLLAQNDYLTGYGGWLDNIQKNKDNLLTFSIFNDPNSFSGRNIIKTADEFEKLQGVELALGADGAVDTFMTFPLTDFFLLAVLLLVALSFLEERKAGLWSVVHAAPRGRLRLAVRRAAILLGTSVVGVLLLYGTNLVLAFSLYGGIGDLDRAVQSVEALGKLPMLTTVGGFLVRFFLLRVAAAFLVSLLLWLMLTAINNVKYTIIVAAGALAAEYSLYTFLPVQSVFNILKYFNLFTYISLSDLYTNYLNIDIFSYPLGIRSISQLALIPLCPLLTVVCVYVHCHKKPVAGRDLLGRVAYKLNSVTDKFLRRLHLFGMELHKTLWIQKGIVITALLVYVAFGLSYTASIPITSSAEQAAQYYTAEFAGEITDDTFTRIKKGQAELDATETAYEKAQTDFENGLIEYPELDKYSREAASARIKSDGLANVRSRAEDLRDKGAAEGFTPWLIDETPFVSIYGNRAQGNQQQAALVAILALTLLLAGSMAYERQSGMTYLLKSTVRGRGALVLRKLLLAAVMTTLVWAVVYGMEVYTLLSSFEISAWSAPARNLSMLTAFSPNCSITGWLVLLYVFRWMMLLCGAVIVLFVSSCLKRIEAAYISASAVMLLPSLLYAYIGIGIFRPLSIIMPVAAMPILTVDNGAMTAYMPWFAALLGIATIIIIWLFVPANRIRRKKA